MFLGLGGYQIQLARTSNPTMVNKTIQNNELRQITAREGLPAEILRRDAQ